MIRGLHTMSERLEIAGRALQRPLCNHCLGRLFASVSRGLSNDQRGAIVRSCIRDSPKQPISISDCHVCRWLFSELQKFADISARASEGYEFSTFLVGTKVDAEVLEREESFWTEPGAKEIETIKTEMNREIGKLLEKRLIKEVGFRRTGVGVMGAH